MAFSCCGGIGYNKPADWVSPAIRVYSWVSSVKGQAVFHWPRSWGDGGLRARGLPVSFSSPLCPLPSPPVLSSLPSPLLSSLSLPFSSPLLSRSETKEQVSLHSVGRSNGHLIVPLSWMTQVLSSSPLSRSYPKINSKLVCLSMFITV